MRPDASDRSPGGGTPQDREPARTIAHGADGGSAGAVLRAALAAYPAGRKRAIRGNSAHPAARSIRPRGQRDRTPGGARLSVSEHPMVARAALGCTGESLMATLPRLCRPIAGAGAKVEAAGARQAHFEIVVARRRVLRHKAEHVLRVEFGAELRDGGFQPLLTGERESDPSGRRGQRLRGVHIAQTPQLTKNGDGIHALPFRDELWADGVVR